MTEPVRERVEEPVRSTMRGQDQATPARALTGVIVVVGVVAAVLIVALLIVWSAVK
jgi:hypothetical protein